MSSSSNRGSDGPPTLLARRYVAYLVGFGVAVATGAAVFLGMSRIPLFSPLLSILPERQRDLLLPLSSFLVGLVALAVQFYSGERIMRDRLRRRFGVGLVLLLVGLLVLLTLTSLYVEEVQPPGLPDEPQPEKLIFISGLWQRADCECGSVSLEKCMEGLAYDPGLCWSDLSVGFSTLSLSLSYLAVIGGFGALVGLLLLQETARRQEAARKHKRSKARRPTRKRRRATTDEPPEPAKGTDA